MKRLILISLFTVSIFFCAGNAMASDISEALYCGDINVSNNGTSTTNVATIMSLNPESLIDTYGVDDDFDYVAIRNTGGDDVPFMPSDNATNPWCLWAPSINENSSFNDIIYIGQTDLGATKYYFPGDAGMTISDNETIELSDNCTVTYSGYIDFENGTDNYTIYKQEAFKMYLSGEDEITAEIYGGGSEVWTNPTSWYDEGGGGSWSSPPMVYDDNTTTYTIQSIGYSGYTSYLDLLLSSPIYSNKIRFYAEDAGGGYHHGIFIDIYNYDTSSWVNIYTGTYSDKTWETKTFSPTTISKARVRIANGYPGETTVKLYEFDFGEITPLTVTESGLESGKYKVEAYADGTDFKLEIDDEVVDSVALDGASVLDNDNDWYIGSSATPYIEYFSVDINGENECYIEWEYDTIFHDQSGNSNDATPSFRTASSDADVSAELTSFSPVNQASAPDSLASDWPTMIEDAPGQPESMYTENSTPGIFFAPLVHAIWQHSGIPESFFWYNFTFFFIIAAGILAFRLHQSLLLKTIVMTAIMILWALPGVNVYGMFVVLYFALFSAGLLILSKSYGW